MNENPADASRFSLLIVDDEKNIRFSLSERFKDEYKSVRSVSSGATALEVLERETIDIVLLDQNLKESGESGIDVLGEIKKEHPHIVVIIMTAFGRFDQAMEAARLGCTHYLSKPLDLDQLDLTMRNALATADLEREVARLRDVQRQRHRVDLVMSEGGPMSAIVEMSKRVARSPSSTVLISGETGVGKELVARLVHLHSPRSHGSFVEVNCSAIHENLLESELFGHERGAFTDARRAKPGLFELADGGTLFLDEIGEMSPTVQAKLLRVLEQRRFRRVGGTEDRTVDVRVVAATNRDLRAMVDRGEFREDLFYRLSVIPLHVPPLRERPADVPLLVRHFVDAFNSEFDQKVTSITDDAMESLAGHRWNGNVRELRNVIERVMLTIEDEVVGLGHLPHGLGGSVGTAARTARAERPTGPSSASTPMIDPLFAPGNVPRLSELETWGIHRAMAVTGNNKTRAAELLGISRQTLRMKLKDAARQTDAGDTESASSIPH